MSKRLLEMIQNFLVKVGDGEKVLARAVDKHPHTVQRWIKRGRIPDVHDRYLIALQCGCSEKEALVLASEGFSEVAKETA